MESLLEKNVIGQKEAVTAIRYTYFSDMTKYHNSYFVPSNVIRLSRAGLHAHNRPLGSFLFLGPTGVGKTELCKQLSVFLFDSEAAMVRIDMSEYMERHTVSRLLGAPPVHPPFPFFFLKTFA